MIIGSEVSIQKSGNDPRQYLGFKLQNNMRVVVVSDPESIKSAASLSIEIGQLHDPKAFQGLAHFCEHMLFMGTTKYPIQNEYSQYLSQNGGTENAYTELMNTNYYFDIKSAAFEGGLDRFSQFFISPLFDNSCVEKEINAVESEHQMNLSEDSFKQWSILKAIASQSSSFSQHGGGNLASLQKEGIRDALIEFFNKYYSSHRMSLVIYGKESIEELQALVVKYFSSIPERKPQSIHEENEQFVHPFPSSNLGKLVKVITMKDEDTIEFWWVVDDQHKHWRTKPDDFIQHIFGHEGKNSLISLLIDEGLALEITSSSEHYMRSFTGIGFTIVLTKKGFEEYNRVYQAVFTYINILKECIANESAYLEVKEIEGINFRFLEKIETNDYVCKIADDLLAYPMEEVLKARFSFAHFDENLINSVIKSLEPSNLILFVSSQSFDETQQDQDEDDSASGNNEDIEESKEQDLSSQIEEEVEEILSDGKKDGKTVEKLIETTNKQENLLFQVEPFSGGRYNLSEIESSELQGLDQVRYICEFSKKEFGLPPKNIFIPRVFESLEQKGTKKYPCIVYESDMSELYYKRDDTFGICKTYCDLFIFTNVVPQMVETARPSVLNELWISLFNHYMNETKYLANMAQIKMEIEQHYTFTKLRFKGYSDTLHLLFESFLTHLTTFSPDFEGERTFNAFKEKLKQEYENYYIDAPHATASDLVKTSILTSGSFPPLEKIKAIKELTLADIVQYSNTWLDKARIESIIMGNISETEAVTWIKKVEETLKGRKNEFKVLSKNEIPLIQPSIIPKQQPYILEFSLDQKYTNPEETNSCIFAHFQKGPETPAQRVHLKLLNQYLSEPLFDQLRTNEKIGYIVWCWEQTFRGVSGFSIVVQSAVNSPEFVAERIQSFLKETKKSIRKLKLDDFNNIKNSLSVKLTEKPRTLSKEFQYFSDEILTHKFVFDRMEKIAGILDAISLDDFIREYDNLFFDEAKLLEIHVISKDHAAEQKRLLKQRKQKNSSFTLLKNDMHLRKISIPKQSLYHDYSSPSIQQ